LNHGLEQRVEPEAAPRMPPRPGRTALPIA